MGTSVAMPNRGADVVRLFDYEPDLLARLPGQEADTARHYTVVESVTLARGDLRPPAIRAAAVDLGFLVLDGLLLHRVEHVGRAAVELLGPGDLIRPWRPADDSASLPSRASWRICEPARLALLDRRFEREFARWPSVLSAVLDRLDNRFRSLSVQLALAKLPRLDARLLCLFWHLADRWGRVERDGIVVEMALSHQTLADLVSARRPSVSHALAELRDSGLLTRLAYGRWLLRGESPSQRPRAVDEPSLAIA